jgi:hypothetical protein
VSKYSLILSSLLPSKTVIPVYELYKNGESIISKFFREIEQNPILLNQFAGAIRILEDTANLNRRPKSKFRLIIGHKLNCKVYESKYGSIRIYLYHEEKTGRIIVAGGLKDTQAKDIKSAIKLIKDYHDTIK